MERVARPRFIEGGTPFTNWIRTQQGLESHGSAAFVGSDVDLVWYNYKLAMIMLLEEKQRLSDITPSQEATQQVIHQALRFALTHPRFLLKSLRKPIPTRVAYCGYHLIQFQNTGPEDGDIYIDHEQVSRERFIKFLQFQWTPSIQCYIDQQEWLSSATNTSELEQATQKIKQSITNKRHPELALLRSLWKEKKNELTHIDTLFSDDEDEEGDTNLPEDIIQMQEAERIVQERDIEELARLAEKRARQKRSA